MSKDRITGLVALLLGIVTAVCAYQLPPSNMAGDVGPAVFPYICAALLILCGGGLVLKNQPDEGKPYFTKQQFLRLVCFFVLILLYVLSMDLFGYLPSTLIFSFLLCMLFRQRSPKAILSSAVFSVLLTGGIYVCFLYVFSLVLPHGRLM